MEIKYKLYSLIKNIQSFFKTEWEVTDYPIRYRKQNIPPEFKENSKIKMYEWSAQVINWWSLCGDGNSKEEALQNLMENFNAYKASGRKFYRPGREVPLEWAPAEIIGNYAEIEMDFLKNVLDKDASDCFTSDESSIFDFICLMDDEDYNKEILRINQRTIELYNTDISDITSSDGNLVKIYEKISRRGDVT